MRPKQLMQTIFARKIDEFCEQNTYTTLQYIVKDMFGIKNWIKKELLLLQLAIWCLILGHFGRVLSPVYCKKLSHASKGPGCCILAAHLKCYW